MSRYEIVRSALIDAEPAALYAQVIDFRNWTAWSPWEDLNPDMRREYSGEPSGPGARYAWEGRKSGTGTMEILTSRPDEQIDIDLRFTKPFRAINPTTFTFAQEDEGTRVTWTMRGEHRGLGALIARVLRINAKVGADFEKGLARLAEVVSG